MTVQDYKEADELLQAALSRINFDLAQLDYRRALKHLEQRGHSQPQMARVLGISQPAVNSALKTARKVPEAMPGFSGASPYEICQRYALGKIDRAQLIDELTRWEYTPVAEPDWLEDIVPGPGPGSWFEVERALGEGLIDGSTYEEVLERKFPSAT